MGLEGLDGALGGIAAMDVWRDELVLHFPHVFKSRFEFGAEFVVKFGDHHCGRGWLGSA